MKLTEIEFGEHALFHMSQDKNIQARLYELIARDVDVKEGVNVFKFDTATPNYVVLVNPFARKVWKHREDRPNLSPFLKKNKGPGETYKMVIIVKGDTIFTLWCGDIAPMEPNTLKPFTLKWFKSKVWWSGHAFVE